MLVLSSPSGAGKSTIARGLLQRHADLSLSISVTTRPKRPLENDGEDYIFKGREEFENLINNNEFLEYAEVFGHFYGTPKSPVEKLLNSGKDILFDVDWQGTQQLRQNTRKDLVSIFILPPSLPELERRLQSRAQDSPEVVKSRMAKASSEMSHWAEYDYIIVNKNIEASIDQAEAIFLAERLNRERQIGLHELVRSLGVKQ